jgi:hypothetical protein
MMPEQLKQTILDAFSSVGSDGKGKDGLQGFLAKLTRENPQLAEDARSYTRHFAEAGYGPPILSDGRGGPGVACQLAVGNIHASTHFLLHSIGLQAARRMLSETAAAPEEDIVFANANSGFLS